MQKHPVQISPTTTFHGGMLLIVLLFAMGAAGCATTNHEKTSTPSRFSFFHRPARNSSAEQLAYAHQLRRDGRTGKARRYYHAVTLKWPNTSEAIRAQYEYALLLDKEGAHLEAFEEFAALLAEHGDAFPRAVALEHQLNIATWLLERRKWPWLFGGFQASERAIPYLTRILQYAPDWSRASEAQYMIAWAYGQNRRFSLAIDACNTFQSRYPTAPQAKKAAFIKAHCLYMLAHRNPLDAQSADKATTALTAFLDRFPKSENAQTTRAYLEELEIDGQTRTRRQADRAYEEKARGHRWWNLLGRPRKDTPAAQLTYADALRTRGSFRRAGRHYHALVTSWPNAPEAAKAQYQHAKLLDKRGKDLDAFEEYSKLMKRYAGQFPHEEVLERQFRIAADIMDRRKGGLLFFKGFTAPERAIPLFEEIIEHGPSWEKAPEAQYLIGRAYDKTGQHELAITAYTSAEYNYPEAFYAEKASFAKAYDFYLLAQESPNDEKLAEACWAALTMYINTYPRGVNITEATEYRKALYRRRAKDAYDKAVFYDKLARNPEAALLTYRRFIQQFPHSGWTTLAEIRIQELTSELE